MRYGKLTAGVPVPANTKSLLDIDGVRYPPVSLRDKSFRDANGIVEIQNQSYDSKYEYLGSITGYSDLTNGVWQENQTILNKSTEQVLKLRIVELSTLNDSSVSGGMIFETNNFDITEKLLLRLTGVRGRARPVTKLPTQEGTLVSFTPPQLAAFDTAMTDHVNDAHDNMIAHIEAMATLTTSQAIIDYDLTVGWPVNPLPVDPPEVVV